MLLKCRLFSIQRNPHFTNCGPSKFTKYKNTFLFRRLRLWHEVEGKDQIRNRRTRCNSTRFVYHLFLVHSRIDWFNQSLRWLTTIASPASSRSKHPLPYQTSRMFKWIPYSKQNSTFHAPTTVIRLKSRRICWTTTCTDRVHWFFASMPNRSSIFKEIEGNE